MRRGNGDEGPVSQRGSEEKNASILISLFKFQADSKHV
jgi:hypothetical protein